MDPIAVGIGDNVDMGMIRGIIAAITMLVYLGIFYWAYRRDNRERFDEDALLPFADDGGLPSSPAPDEEETVR
jgi:cytochrome c oxidase cbb3-type subunit 4